MKDFSVGKIILMTNDLFTWKTHNYIIDYFNFRITDTDYKRAKAKTRFWFWLMNNNKE